METFISLQLLTTVLSIFISITVILGIISKFSSKIFSKAARRSLEMVKYAELDPRSEIHKTMKKVKELDEVSEILKDNHNKHEACLYSIQRSLESINKELEDSKRERFKSDLRARLEYVISKKGRVDKPYWEYIVDDYMDYVDNLKLNSYIVSLYKEAETHYIKVNVRKESTE